MRSVWVKAERRDGGMNGIDVESFFKAISVRQFFKSDMDRRLALINKSSTIHEEIKTLARETIRSILLKQLRSDQDNEEWAMKTPASLFVKTYSKNHVLLESMGITTISSINFELMTRGESNKIRR